jgi:hypothetical protein
VGRDMTNREDSPHSLSCARSDPFDKGVNMAEWAHVRGLCQGHIRDVLRYRAACRCQSHQAVSRVERKNEETKQFILGVELVVD